MRIILRSCPHHALAGQPYQHLLHHRLHHCHRHRHCQCHRHHQHQQMRIILRSCSHRALARPTYQHLRCSASHAKKPVVYYLYLLAFKLGTYLYQIIRPVLYHRFSSTKFLHVYILPVHQGADIWTTLIVSLNCLELN